MTSSNIRLKSFKTMVFIIGSIAVILFIAACGGGGGSGPEPGDGSLMVTLATDTGEDIPAVAQWRLIVNDSWHNSGEELSGLAVGSHTVEFKDVTDWDKPANLTVSISKDETTMAVGTYRRPSGGTSSVTGKVDDDTPNSPVSKADCVFVDMNGAIHYSTTADDDGIYLFSNVLPDMEGYIRCHPPNTSRLHLTTYLNMESYAGEDEDVTPTTTVVAMIIDSTNPDDPMQEKKNLFDRIAKGGTGLNALVRMSRILFKNMHREKVDVFFGGGPGADYGGGGDAGGEVGDGAIASPIADAVCDFVLDLDGEVLYYAALKDLHDGKVDRPDLASIKDEVEEELKDLSAEQIKEAFDQVSKSFGKPISDVAGDDGMYSMRIPPNVQGYVRCAPPDQPNLKLATFVPKMEPGKEPGNFDVKPQTTVFSYRIAAKLSDDLSTVKKNYLEEIEGLKVDYTQENGEITGFEVIEPENFLAGEKTDEGVGLVAFSATALFNIFYQNATDIDYPAVLKDFIAKKRVDPEFLVNELDLPEAEADNAATIVNEAVVKTEKDEFLGIDLDSALSTARVKVRVVNRGAGVANAMADITDFPSGVSCRDCPGETDQQGEVTLTLIGVPEKAIPVEVEVSSVAGYEAIRKPTKVVAFATVDLEIAFSNELTVQGAGTGSGTVTSVPSGISCDISGGVAGDYNSEYFDADTEVVLTAEKSQDSTFDGWSGSGCSGTGTCTVTMDQAHTVIATFTRQEPILSPTLLSPNNNAVMDNNCEDQSDSIDWAFSWSSVAGATKYQINVISSTGGTYIDETVITTTFDYSHETHFEPDSSRQGWSWKVRAGNDNDIWSEWSEQRSFDIEPLNKDCQLTLTVQGGGNGSGVVTSSPGDINCTINGTSESGGCSDSFNLGTPVVLTAGKTGGSTFDGWSGGGCDTTNPCMVTMNQAHTVIATFTRQEPILSPTLLSPNNNAVMDNNCEDQSDSIDWAFSWSSVAGATKYQINVISSTGGTYIDETVTATTFDYSHETHVEPDSSRQGWGWKVRAGNDSGIWSEWSEQRSFDIEPLNTDCPCTYSIDPPSRIFPPSGGPGSISVFAPSFCSWTPSGSASWITITSGSGSGDGTVRYSVSANTGISVRSAVITVADKSHTVTQDPISLEIPTLLLPLNNAVMDNNCEDQSDSIDWSFSWSSVAGATKYQINVISSTGGTYIDEMVTATTFNYSHGTDAEPDSSRQGWSWKVRAGNDSGIWSGWSERSFDIEPLNTDCPENISPTATITNPANNSRYDEGDTIRFTGFGDDAEDGTLTGSFLVWTSSIDGQIGTGTTFTRDTLSVGTHTITLTATDSDGATGSDLVSITVSPLFIPVANAGIDQSVTEGDMVTLDGTGSSDADGSIVSYLWEQESGTAVTLTGDSTSTATFTAPDVGLAGETLRFRLTVTDNHGQSSSDTVNVAVTDTSIAGNWLVTNYLGNTFYITIEARGDNKYYILPDIPGSSGTYVHAGLYEVRNNYLIMIEPYDPSYPDARWEIINANYLYLTNTGYAGTTLTRFAGTWLHTNSIVGNTFHITIEARGDNKYYMLPDIPESSGTYVHAGLYEVRGNYLVKIEPYNLNYPDATWEVINANYLYLTDTGYEGATLTR